MSQTERDNTAHFGRERALLWVFSRELLPVTQRGPAIGDPDEFALQFRVGTQRPPRCREYLHVFDGAPAAKLGEICFVEVKGAPVLHAILLVDEARNSARLRIEG